MVTPVPRGRLPAFILALCDFGHASRWYHRSKSAVLLQLPLAPLSKGGAMTERNFTEREDRLVGICLAALAIIVVFIFVTSG